MKFGEQNVFSAITKITNQHFHNRDIVVIGNNLKLVEYLNENGLSVKEHCLNTKSVSAAKDADTPYDALPKLRSLRFLPLLQLQPQNSYLIFTDDTRSGEFKRELKRLGYREFRDYVFVNHGQITIPVGTGDYTDEYGNVVHCKGCKVFLHDSCCNAHIYVDDTAVFDNDCYISARHTGRAEIRIGAGCRFVKNVSVVALGDARITIGAGTKIVQDTNLVATEGHSIQIGENCLFSYEIRIYCGDGHAVFDSVTRERLNPPVHSDRNQIIIGNHVWIGMRAIVLNRCSIGDSSIVGAGTIVKGSFPNNCAIGGNPARRLRNNVTWTTNFTGGIIPEEYAFPTREDF